MDLTLSQDRPFAWLGRLQFTTDRTAKFVASTDSSDLISELAAFSKKQSDALCNRKAICGARDAMYAPVDRRGQVKGFKENLQDVVAVTRMLSNESVVSGVSPNFGSADIHLRDSLLTVVVHDYKSPVDRGVSCQVTMSADTREREPKARNGGIRCSGPGRVEAVRQAIAKDLQSFFQRVIQLAAQSPVTE